MSITIKAKLTPFGREQLLLNDNKVIKYFVLGDSDANYLTSVANITDIPPFSSDLTNNTTNNVKINSIVPVNNNGVTFKEIESNSYRIVKEEKISNLINITSANFEHNIIDFNSGTYTDNLFKSFNLPILENEKEMFNDIQYINGGYEDTALKMFGRDKILVVKINNNFIGEIIDGKSVRFNLLTSGNNYNIYGTYQNGSKNDKQLDTSFFDQTYESEIFGGNVVFLFSDQVRRPNNELSRSWATGYNTEKPFTQHKKEKYNLNGDVNLNFNVDLSVGIAYLDKGYIIITDPNIINDYESGFDSGSNISLKYKTTEVFQPITCILNRGEFGTSLNNTFNDDVVRISEIGLYDANYNLIAIGKMDKQLLRNVNEFLVLTIKLII